MDPQTTVGVIFYNIGPYHHARLNAASDFARVIAFEWSACATEPWGAASNPAKYQKRSLFSDVRAGSVENRGLQSVFSAALDELRPDVMAINGWNDFGSLVAVKCCADRRIPLVLMSESTARDEPRVWWKEVIKRRLVRLYSSALVGGRRHADYLEELGIKNDRIFRGYDVVDNEYFTRATTEVRSKKTEVRDKHRLPENYFLASARFIAKKNLGALIRAYGAYYNRAGKEAWHLVILGDGPLKGDLSRLIADLGLGKFVHLPGFKQYDELQSYYGLANAFVHASISGHWGLVVNEAVASGLPVIVSNRCGCMPELVRDNGFAFDPSDERELASRLLEMA